MRIDAWRCNNDDHFNINTDTECEICGEKRPTIKLFKYQLTDLLGSVKIIWEFQNTKTGKLLNRKEEIILDSSKGELVLDGIANKEEVALIISNNIAVYSESLKILLPKPDFTLFKSESSYNWWKKLPDIWKDIFKSHISESNSSPISFLFLETTETPSYEEFEKIFQIKHIYCFGEIDSVLPIIKLNNLSEARFKSCWNVDWDEESIIFENFKNLKVLEISHASLSDISNISKLKNLEELYINYNQIENISLLSNLTNLKVLDLESNKVSDFSFLKQLPNLEHLYISNQYFESRYYSHTIHNIEFLINLKKIRSLRLDKLSLSDLTHISYLRNLKYLFLDGNNITNVEPLCTLISLEKLDLEDNSNLTNIEPLKFLRNLKYLNLKNTAFNTVNPLKDLKYLNTLEVSIDHDTDITAFMDLHNVRRLYIDVYNENVLGYIEMIKTQLNRCIVIINDHSGLPF